MSDLEGWSKVVEDDNDQEEEEVNLKLKKISLCHSGNWDNFQDYKIGLSILDDSVCIVVSSIFKRLQDLW